VDIARPAKSPRKRQIAIAVGVLALVAVIRIPERKPAREWG
jgi:hypothetical protein